MIVYDSDLKRLFDWTLKTVDNIKDENTKVIFLKTVIQVLSELLNQ